jgi:hypothetical protein
MADYKGTVGRLTSAHAANLWIMVHKSKGRLRKRLRVSSSLARRGPMMRLLIKARMMSKIPSPIRVTSEE